MECDPLRGDAGPGLRDGAGNRVGRGDGTRQRTESYAKAWQGRDSSCAKPIL